MIMEAYKEEMLGELQSIATKAKVKMLIHPNGHIELRGYTRVQYYPFSKNRTAYLPASKIRKTGVDLNEAVTLASGKSMEELGFHNTRRQEKEARDYDRRMQLDVEREKVLKPEDLDGIPVLTDTINIVDTRDTLSPEEVRRKILPILNQYLPEDEKIHAQVLQEREDKILRGQKKRWSAIETLTSTAVGFVLSMVANAYVIPWMFAVTVPFTQNIELTLIYTVLSLARGYFVRRAFNRIPH